MKNALKILYILIAGTGIFLIGDLYILLGINLVHLLVFLLIKNETKSFKFLIKIKWFILLVFLFHAFIGNNDLELFTIKGWTLALSYDGMLKGAAMVLKLVGMLIITQVVRLTMAGKDFTGGMMQLGLSKSSAEIIDEIITIVSLEKTDKQKTGNFRKNKADNHKKHIPDRVTSKDVLLRAKVGNIPKKLMNKISFANKKFSHSPNAVIASSALAVTLIRMVKIAPGLPLAPGHKNILLFPVLIYGITQSKKNFAGLQIGFISGVLHFIMGFGKYGPLGIFQFALLGFVVDLLVKLRAKSSNLLFLMVVGGFCGLVRVTTEIILALVLGMPNTFYYLYFPYIISQVSFGIASGFVSKSILKPTEK